MAEPAEIDVAHVARLAPLDLSEEAIMLFQALLGKPLDEATLLQIAHAYEQSTDWPNSGRG